MIRLYIATHNETGLKYFGKTKKYHTQEELQEFYHGSGIYWNNHLKKYGDDVTMEIWYQDENQEAVKRLALMFSETYNISKSKEWANLCPENGINGGATGFCKHSEESKQKMSEAKKGKNNPMYNKKHSQKTKEKMRENNLGENNPMFGKYGEDNPHFGMKRSEETKQKMREARKGYTHSEKTKEKLKKSRIGRKPNLGKKHSEETKKILSENMKNTYWVNNGIIQKRINKIDLNKYLELGFIRGRIKKQKD